MPKKVGYTTPEPMMAKKMPAKMMEEKKEKKKAKPKK